METTYIGKKLFVRCENCGVFILPEKMDKHLRTQCDGEEGRKQRSKDSAIALGMVNKALKKCGVKL